MVDSAIIKVIQLMASKSPYAEICGLIDSNNIIYPILNVSTGPADFIMSKAMYGKAINTIRVLGRSVQCVYHSHLNGDPTPSPHDLSSLKRCNMDYLIVAGSKYTYVRAPHE